MLFHSRPFPARLAGILAALALTLSACGYERIAQLPAAGETGEFYSSGSPSSHAISLQAEFSAFCEQVFREEMSGVSTLDLHYTLLEPEACGIERGEASLGSYGLEELIRSGQEARGLKTQLEQFDRESLTEDQQLLYDTLEETLSSTLLREGLELYEQPLAPTIGIQAQLPILLAEYSFRSVRDVEDYLSLLSQIDGFYQQLLDFEQQKADAGLAPSDASIDRILEACESYRSIDPENNFLTETFETRLEALSESAALTEEAKQDFRSRHLAAIRSHFIPAYEKLISGMTALKGRGLQDGGLSMRKDGKRYYEYLLKSGPGLSWSVEELKQALTDQMKQDLTAISSLYSRHSEAAVSSGVFSLTEPEEILESLKQQMADDFPALADCGYEIRYVPRYLEEILSPAFYLTAPLDDVNRNVIYINNGYSDSTESLYTTLAHEGFPGHLYQTVYSRTHASSPLASILSCSGANEGWATYVENYACTFDNGLPEGAGEYRARLRSFSLCLHGLLDIGINYDGWSPEQAGSFIQSYFQADDAAVMELWQTMIDNPTNYLEYCGGYVELMDMRAEAEEALAGRFRPLEFHRFILDTGPVPFSVMRAHFSRWLERQGS